MPQKKTVLCFCKYPDPGAVKLRLASRLGEELAAIIYKILLEHIVQMVCAGGHECALYCYPDTRHAFFRYCSSKYPVSLYTQDGCDLGARMFNALDTHLDDARHVVLVGSDCPELEPAYISQAFRLLEAGNDIVLGPANDGGYALIGAKKINQSVFNDISWSTNRVLQQTQDKIKDLHWKSTCMPLVRDIDTFSDYRYFLEHEHYRHLFSAISRNCVSTS